MHVQCTKTPSDIQGIQIQNGQIHGDSESAESNASSEVTQCVYFIHFSVDYDCYHGAVSGDYCAYFDILGSELCCLEHHLWSVIFLYSISTSLGRLTTRSATAFLIFFCAILSQILLSRKWHFEHSLQYSLSV